MLFSACIVVRSVSRHKNMKRIKLLFFSAVCAISAYAQLSGDGYYRVQNEYTGRYLTVIDNRGSINVQTTDADLGALRTVKDFARVVSDPASIVYIKKMTKGYDLQSQGMDTYAMISRELMVLDLEDGTYAAYATQSGLTKYLCDNIPNWMMTEEEKIYGSVCTNSPDSKYWYINPVKSDDGYFFGLTPDVSAAGSHYKAFYASFPFSFASSAMKAYYVTKVDAAKGCAVVKELSGTIPAATPLIVKCSSDKPADNKLNLLTSTASAPSDNLLKGQYFCNPDAGKHTNVLAYNASTMRVLGKASDGSLAFVVQSGLKYIPANTAYLTVAANTAKTLKIMTETEYNQMLAEEVTITANSYTRVYGEANPSFEYSVTGATLKGVPGLSCGATETSPVGLYPIKVAQGSVTNALTHFVDGFLTITPAELTVTVADATRDEGEENPSFVLTYEGFVNGETESVLKVKPTVSTTATKDSPAGEYAISVSGGVADNYVLKYVGGKLTVNEKADEEVTITANSYTRVYGEANPVLEYSVEGSELKGVPRLSCEATETSAVGQYPIKVDQGSVTNALMHFVDGVLTITPAVLKVSVADAAREEGEENPSFVLTYEGFVNGETESVLKVKPTASTTATKESPAGEYAITVSGGVADNYVFEYVGGKLTVNTASALNSILTEGGTFDVYDVYGKRVLSNTRSLGPLRKGVYVVKGRKVIVK